MKSLLQLLLVSFTLAVLVGQTFAQDDAAAAEAADESALQTEEKEVEEVVADIKQDEQDVAAAKDETEVKAEEAQVVHDEAIMDVQMEDVDEMMQDIKDDEMDADADLLDRKLNDVKDAKDNKGKSDAERRKLELEKKKKRNAARKAKHDARAKKHAERHAKVDKWIEEMRKEHGNKVKRDAMKSLYSLLTSEHTRLHNRLA